MKLFFLLGKIITGVLCLTALTQIYGVQLQFLKTGERVELTPQQTQQLTLL